MKLKDAWNQIKEMNHSDLFSPTLVYSVLSDLQVFIDMPCLQVITKIALQNGLWEFMKSDSRILSDIKTLQSKLEFFGFSNTYIHKLFSECGISYVLMSNRFGNDETKTSPKFDTQSNLLKLSKRPLTESSSKSEIEDYLNSIFEIDQESFQRDYLTLQRIDKLKWKKGTKYNSEEYGINISYEIIGKEECTTSINLYVYDKKGYLREVKWIDTLIIKNEFSIRNENKTESITISPSEISKIVLRIDKNISLQKLFDIPVRKLIKYDGIVEGKFPFADLTESQILVNDDNYMSFYFRFKINTSITIYNRVYSLLMH